MAKFVKLTVHVDNSTTYINVASIACMRRGKDRTVVSFDRGDYVEVVETPEQILQMIADETPPPVSAGEFPRMWRDGWSGSFDWHKAQEAMRRHNGMLPTQWSSNKDWERVCTGVTSFDQIADALLRPVRPCQPSDCDKQVYDEMMKNAQEPLDGPPDM